MTEHPLTEDMLNQIQSESPTRIYGTEAVLAAYDLGRDEQLEQVIEWLKDHAAVYMYEAHDGPCFDEDGLLDDFEKAMRPTTTQEEN